MDKVMKRLAKFFFSIIVIVILVVFVLAIIMQTEWFKAWLKQKLIRQAQQAVMGELHISDISGGLFSGFSSHQIHWLMEGDTLLSVARLKFDLQPLELLNKTIEIQNLEIHSPRIFLAQADDGQWNLMRLVKQKQPSDSTSEWRLQLKSLRLLDGRLILKSTQPHLSLNIDDIEIELSVRYLPRLAMGHLHQCHFQLSDYDFSLSNLSGFFIFRRDSLYCKNMNLTTGRSSLQFDLQMPIKGSSGFHLTMNSQNFDFKDVRAFVPQFPSSKQIQIEGSALQKADSLFWHVRAWQKNQSLTLDGTCRFPIENSPIRAQLILDRLSIDHWFDDPILPMTLNGALSVIGSGFDPNSADWRLFAEFNRSRILQTEIRQATIESLLSGDSLKTNIELNGDWGEAHTHGRAFSLYHQPKYSIHLDCRKFNLAGMLQKKTPSSNLNFQATVNGSGFDPKITQLIFSLTAQPSTIENIPIDHLHASGSYRQGSLRLDSLLAISAVGKLHIEGSHQPSRWIDLRYSGQIKDTTFIGRWLDHPKMQLNAIFNGQLVGLVDSLEAFGNLALDNSVYDDISVNRLSGKWRISGLGSEPYGSLKLQSYGITLSPSFTVDSAFIDARVFKDLVFLDSRIDFADSIWSKLRTELKYFDSTLVCNLTDIQFAFKNQLWSGGSDSTFLYLSHRWLQVNHFSLMFQDQLILLNGSMGDPSTEALELFCKNIDLAVYNKFFPPSWRLAGQINWYSKLTGTLNDPIIYSSSMWRNGGLGNFVFDSLGVNLEYKDEKVLVRMHLQEKQKKPLTLSAEVPIGVSLEKPSAIVFTDRPLQAQLQLQEMPLSFFSAFVPDLMINGRVSGMVQLQNSLDHPQPSGSLTIQGDRIDSPSLGKPWRQINARLELDSTAIWLRSLSLKGGDGILRGEGFFAYDLHNLAKPIGNYILRLRPDGFTPVDLREISITLDGDIRIEKKNQASSLTGELTIERSRFDLTELLATPSTIMLPDRPLLVVTQEDTFQQAYDASVLAPSWLKYLDNVRGSVKIEAPRNTWLRSREMNVEISGSLDLVKQGPVAELFGSIRILRGAYDLYSRRFDIQNGTLTFLGGEKFNPNVDLEAEYVFRGIDRSKKTLKLIVGGQLFNPTMRFTLDGLEISETDAIAYLLFGRSFDLLTQGEKSDLQQGQQQTDMSSEAMKQLLSWQIAGQLSNSLRQQLKLDVIEFRGDQNWRQATVVVGKYLTNDLFISYQRDFDFSRSNAAVPEQVTLEYEILRSLHIQATRSDESRTGFDIIWKYEK